MKKILIITFIVSLFASSISCAKDIIVEDEINETENIIDDEDDIETWNILAFEKHWYSTYLDTDHFLEYFEDLKAYVETAGTVGSKEESNFAYGGGVSGLEEYYEIGMMVAMFDEYKYCQGIRKKVVNDYGYYGKPDFIELTIEHNNKNYLYECVFLDSSTTPDWKAETLRCLDIEVVKVMPRWDDYCRKYGYY